jgi:membrane protease YdiL (CAAX protease family)
MSDTAMTRSLRDGLALAFASTFPLASTWTYFVACGGHGKPSGMVVAVYAVAKSLQFAFPLAYVCLFDRDRLARPIPDLRGWPLALLFAAVIDAGLFGLYTFLQSTPLLEGVPAHVAEKLRELNIVGLWGYVGLALFVCIPHAAFEEYYWRWFVFGWMRRYLPFWPAAILAGLAFMAHHVVILVVFFPDQVWTLAVPLSLCVAVGGVAWAWFYERTGSLGAVWLCHGLIDLGIMLVGWHMVRGTW